MSWRSNCKIHGLLFLLLQKNNSLFGCYKNNFFIVYIMSIMCYNSVGVTIFSMLYIFLYKILPVLKFLLLEYFRYLSVQIFQ